VRSTSKIVLGTMKLKKYFSNTDDLSIFLNYVHNKGIRQLHISKEYDSYNLLIKSLKKIKKKFTIILKLPEPKKDKVKFNLLRFKQKIFKYRKDLGKKHDFILQFVNRYKCKNPEEYLSNEKKIFDCIENTIFNLKKKKIINSFYFFPYHNHQNQIKRYKFINGITCYRNLYEFNNDKYAKRNNFKIIAIRTLGTNKKKLLKKNLKKLIMFNIKNRIVNKVIIGANNKTQVDEILNL
jgi:hypothetical protein